MKIYNTLTRQKEELVPIKDNTFTMYVCGATVYNRIHLGNGRPMVVFDTLRRYLLWRGYSVVYITNFTDVDDRIIAAANALGVTAKEVSERFISEALVDSDGLNCLRASVYPKATDEIPGIINMIGRIISAGYAYVLDGSVFYDTAAKADYGKLSRKRIKDLEAGARVDVDSRKKNAFDFVLWKPAKPGEPSWASPWGGGRPGWHIECSSMIERFAPDGLDIHAGGEDLIFPHHENEIAQSEAANGMPPARYWIHNGMVNVDEEKMSKSEGNYFLIRELAQLHGYDALRFYVLSAHYRSPIAFTPDNVGAAKNALARLRNCAAELAVLRGKTSGATDETNACEATACEATADKAVAFREAFIKEMDDDLHTANAIAVLFDMVKYANTRMESGMTGGEAVTLLMTLTELCGVLGIELLIESGNTRDEAEITAILDERATARANKDWKRSDELRDRLKGMGVVVKDTADGVKWHYEA